MIETEQKSGLVETALEWRALMADERVADETRRDFQSWVMSDPSHMAAYDHAERFWDGLGNLKHEDLVILTSTAPLPVDSESVFARFASLLAGAFPRPAMAAGVGLASIFALATITVSGLLGGNQGTFAEEWQTYATEVGQVQSFALSDSSLLTLGANSTVEVSYSNDQRRTRIISGEAFFEVQPDATKPFEVTAREMTVRVVGTAFDIQLNEADTVVSVAEGVVDVFYPQVKHVTDPEGSGQSEVRFLGISTSRQIMAGQQIKGSLKAGLSQALEVDPGAVAGWRESRLTYIDAPLAEIIADANRYQSQKIKVNDEALLNIRVSASFQAAEVGNMFQTLEAVLPIQVDRSRDGQIILTEKKHP